MLTTADFLAPGLARITSRIASWLAKAEIDFGTDMSKATEVDS